MSRKEEIRDKISVQAKVKMITAIQIMASYIPCEWCDFYSLGNCSLYKSEIPAHVVSDGCGKGQLEGVQEI